jgi:hypothetical protein
MMLPHGCEGLRVRLMTVLWTCRRPFMGRPVSRQLLRNALRNLITIVSTTAYHRRSYTMRYSKFKPVAFICVTDKFTTVKDALRLPRYAL